MLCSLSILLLIGRSAPWRYCCRLSAFIKALKTSHPEFSCGQKGKQTKSDIKTHHRQNQPVSLATELSWLLTSCLPLSFVSWHRPRDRTDQREVRGQNLLKQHKNFHLVMERSGRSSEEGTQHSYSRHYYGSVLEYFGLLKWEEITLHNSLVAVCRLTDNISVSRASKQT